ncbi:MAG: hypothetical protein N2689_10075, partial [Verrucomicrobiae bacterium]|nr:hypothetical protein [Verrucomicrobiae bacterium]
MSIQEIPVAKLNPKKFIEEQVKALSAAVGNSLAINALSGGVDSSTVTMLGHRALGNRLKTYFVQNGIMREGEPERVVGLFKKLGVPVEIYDAREQFFAALKGLTDPEGYRLVGVKPVDRNGKLTAGSHFLEKGAAPVAANDLG